MLFQTNGEIAKVRLMNRATIRPPYVHYRRKPDEYIIYIIKKGTMYLRENKIDYKLGPGDFIILEPDYVHEGYEASHCEYYYIHFRIGELGKLNFETRQEELYYILEKRNHFLKSDTISYSSIEEKILLPKYYHYHNYNTFIKVCCLLEEAITHNKAPLEYYKLLTSFKVMEMFVETYRNYVLYNIENTESSIPKSYLTVQELLNYLNDNYREKISSVTIESVTGNNFDYINRVFKQMTAKTIFQYLNGVRINHAKELITTTNMKLSDVAIEAGYMDLYYFSKVFKKTTGISPSLYAKGVLK